MAGILIGRNLEHLKSGIATAKESWKALEARGFTLGAEEVSGLAGASGKERPLLTGDAGGCALEVRVLSDFVHYARTEVAAKPVKGVDAFVGVHPSPGGVMGYLHSWLGQDIQIGDEAFDAGYLITGKPESAAVALLVPSVRDLVVALGPKLAGLTYDKERVAVVLHGVETDAALLGAAIELASAAATWGG